MPPRHRYRTAHRSVVSPARPWWIVGPLWLCGLLACLLLITGGYFIPVATTLVLHGMVLLSVLLPAVLLGLAVSAPFKHLCAASPWPDGFRVVLSLALGLGALALGTLVAGSLEGQHIGVMVVAIPAMLLVAAMVGVGPLMVFGRQMDRSIFRRPFERNYLILLLTCLPVAVLLAAATFPPGTLWRSEGGGYDVLEYHLAAPKIYATFASTAPLAGNVYSYLPANVEMLYTLLMSLCAVIFGPRNILAAIYPSQLLHCGFMLLTAAAVMLLPIKMKRSARFLAGGFLLAIPWIIVTGSEAYDEGGVLLFGTLAVGLALGPVVARRGLLIGLLLGLCMGSKMTAGMMTALPVGLLLIGMRRWREVVVVTVIAGAVYLPWAIRAAVASGGNPVFPVAASVLGHDGWDQTLVERFARGHSAQEHGIGGRLGALVEQTVLDSQWTPGGARIGTMLRGGEEMNSSAPPPWVERFGVLWLAAPIVLIGALLRGPVAWQTALLVLMQTLAWLFFTHLQARFLLPAAPLVALLVGFCAETRSGGDSLALCVVAVQALFCAGLLPIEAHTYRDDPGPWPYIGHDVDIRGEDFWVSEGSTPPFPEGKGVLLIGDAKTLYLTSYVQAYTVFDRNPLGDAFREGGPAAAMKYLRNARVGREHFDFLVIDWNEVARLRRTYGFDDAITPENIAALGALGLRPAEVHARRGVGIYEIGR